MKTAIIILTIILVAFPLMALNLNTGSVSMEFNNVDIANVLQVFSKEKGLNIVAGEDVHGNISVDLHKVTFKKALDAILTTNGYDYSINGDIIKVFKQGKDELKSAIITLKNVSANDMINVAKNFIGPDGKISADKTTNSIIVLDTDKNVKNIKKMLITLDKKSGKALNTKNIQPGYSVRIITLKKARVKDVVSVIKPLFGKKDKIVFDNKSNTIIASASPDVLKILDKVVKKLDVKTRQVMIEAKIMEVNLRQNDSMGMDWFWRNLAKGVYDSDGNQQNLYSFATKIPSDVNSMTSGGIFNFGTIAAKHLSGVIKAISDKSKAKLISAPRLAVLNNDSAEIEINDKWPKKEYSQVSAAGNTARDVTTFEFVDVPIKLSVTPVIGDDNFIDVTVNLQVDNVVEIVDKETNTPRISSRKTTTTLRVKNGETIAIGGLIKNDVINSHSKVPVLGDLPLIKNAFRSSKKDIIRSELIIFITPSIMMEYAKNKLK
jgi:general secretion pathway protein D